MTTRLWALALLPFALIPLPAVTTDVMVNGVALDSKTKQALERTYGVPIRPGRYWYDKVSGVWGIEGGPAFHIILGEFGIAIIFALLARRVANGEWRGIVLAGLAGGVGIFVCYAVAYGITDGLISR